MKLIIISRKGANNMPETYPNQRTVTIHKEPLNKNFLSINLDVLREACMRLTPHELKLYIYLASNANNYNLALSQVAVTEAVNLPRSTYYDQVKNLINKGYLVQRSGNHYDFYELPQTTMKSSIVRESEDNKVVTDGFDFTAMGLQTPSGNGETYNRRNTPTDIINNYQSHIDMFTNEMPRW